MKSTHHRAVIQALFVVFLWATSWVLIKIGLLEIPALTFAGLRYVLAFLCLLPVLLLSPQRAVLRSLSRRTWWRLALLGLLLYSITQGAAFVALAHLPAISVNMFLSFSSVLVAILGIFFLSEKPSILQWGGMVLALLGTLVYFYPSAFQQTQWIGIAAALIGLLANGFAAILGRAVNRGSDLPPLVVTVISIGFGSIVLLAVGIAAQGLPPIGLKGWGIITWLAVINTAFAFTLWNHTLRTLSAAESTIINGTMIIWIPLLAVLFLHETLTGKELIGLVIVAVGTFIVQ